jgi:hypothetical protein
MQSQTSVFEVSQTHSPHKCCSNHRRRIRVTVLVIGPFGSLNWLVLGILRSWTPSLGDPCGQCVFFSGFVIASADGGEVLTRSALTSGCILLSLLVTSCSHCESHPALTSGHILLSCFYFWSHPALTFGHILLSLLVTSWSHFWSLKECPSESRGRTAQISGS